MNKITDNIYVNGSLSQFTEGKEYYLLPGGYEIKNGCGALLIHNASSNTICIKKDTLLTLAPTGATTPVQMMDTCI